MSLLIQSPFRFSDLLLAGIVEIHVYIDIHHLLSCFVFNLVQDYNESYCSQYDVTLSKFQIGLLILIQCLNCREMR